MRNGGDSEGVPAVPRVRHFDASTLEEARCWQAQCKRGLAVGLGVSEFLEQRAAEGAAGEPAAPLNAEITFTKDIGHSNFFKMTFEVTPQWKAEALMTVPKKTGGRFPAVLCVQGVKEDIYPQTEFCVWPYREKRISEGWQPYAHCLAERGYVTISAGFQYPPPGVTGREMSNGAERVMIGIRLLDYLCERDDVDAGSIGAIGICRWGGVACHMAAFDARISALVCTAMLARDQQGVPWPFAGANQPPFDLPDLCSLTAPLPVLYQFGENDPLRPLYPTDAEMEEVKRRHVICGGRRDDIEILWHPGRHAVDPGSPPDFFDRTM